MQKLIEILSGNFRYKLKSINYQQSDSVDGSNTSDLSVYDNCRILNVTKNLVLFNVERTLEFYPEGVFKLSVSFDVERRVREEYCDNVNLNNYDLKSEILKDPSIYFDAVLERVSMLVSQITFAAGFTPIITPPSWIFEESEQ